MCRWLVYKGPDILLSELLITPNHSIIKQSSAATYHPGLEKSPLYSETQVRKRNHTVNADGFGIGWYNRAVTPQPCIFTSVSPAWSNRNLVRMSHVVLSDLVFAHVRAATPGSIVSEQNCHPFRCGRIMFMHNGDIPNFSKMKRQFRDCLSDRTYDMIEGTTDSEHAFALFMNEVENPCQTIPTWEMAKYLVSTIEKITQFIHAYAKKQGERVPGSSLNFAVTDGESVIATRFRSKADEDPPSLYYRVRAVSGHKSSTGGKPPENGKRDIFNLSEGTDNMVAISSEPLTKDDTNWQLVPKDHMVIAYPDGNVSTVPMHYKSQKGQLPVLEVNFDDENFQTADSDNVIIGSPKPQMDCWLQKNGKGVNPICVGSSRA